MRWQKLSTPIYGHKTMKKSALFFVLVAVCVVVMVLAVGIGSVNIMPVDTVNIVLNKMFNVSPFGEISEISRAIVLNIRIPRSILAFICGAALAVSGVIMQSVLRNPLASSFTLGVSSGAALGAGIAILFGISVFGFLTLPVFGLTAGLVTVFLTLAIAAKVDRNLQNSSIILIGMAFSLFANAMITIILALSKEQLQQLIYWQMGSFAMKNRVHTALLFPVVSVAFLTVFGYARQMDIMTLGDEQAISCGVDAKKTKLVLLSFSAVITGCVVSMVGIIGFVDLFTPHIARKIFGARHRYVIPASALLGGAFMVACDLLARTMLSPIELPVGAVTGVLGAPFFIYLYFNKGKASG